MKKNTCFELNIIRFGRKDLHKVEFYRFTFWEIENHPTYPFSYVTFQIMYNFNLLKRNFFNWKGFYFS